MVSFTMVRRHDGLASEYAKGMQHFDCGIAMFQPVAGGDMTPPCVGYHDSKGDWNPIADIAWRGPDGKLLNAKSEVEQTPVLSDGHEPLERAPVKMEQVDIKWRPRTSQGVRQWNVNAQGETPANIPVGADVHAKYKSDSKFGAILICAKPITQIAYNDETLLRSWVDTNKRSLYESHGPQLRRYGLILVTTTYRAPRASINAWMDKDNEALLSAKVKAQMLGSDGITLDVNDQLTDKDWTQYEEGSKKDGVVVFFDGFQYGPLDWWWEGIKLSLGSGGSVREKRGRQTQQNALAVRQAAMDGQRPQRMGLSPRESMVGQSRRSWDGRTVPKNGLSKAQSLPQPRRTSPVNGQNQVGVQRAGPPPTNGWPHNIPRPASMQPGHSEDDQQPLLATAAPSGIGNRLSSGSTATTGSNPRSQDTQPIQWTATAHTDLGLRDSTGQTTTSTMYPDYQEGMPNDSEYPIPGVRGSKQQEQEHHLRRMPFEQISTSRPVTTAYTDHKDWHPNSSAPRVKNSKGQESNGHEMDYNQRRTWDLGASQPEPSSVTPRHSLRHKTSSPSLRKPSQNV